MTHMWTDFTVVMTEYESNQLRQPIRQSVASPGETKRMFIPMCVDSNDTPSVSSGMVFGSAFRDGRIRYCFFFRGFPNATYSRLSASPVNVIVDSILGVSSLGWKIHLYESAEHDSRSAIDHRRRDRRVSPGPRER